MPSWIATKDVSTGDYFDAQRWNNVVSPYGDLSYFQNLVNATSTNVQLTLASQLIPNNILPSTTITWSSATIPNTDMWTTGSDITLPSAGIYFIIVESRFLTSAANNRGIIFDYASDGVNFSTLLSDIHSQATVLYHTITWLTIRNRVNVGGKVRISVYQNSGAANSLTANLTVQKLGDLYDY